MRARRGLSTVVGMVFSIIALSTTLVYITYSMNTLDQYNQVVLSKNQQLLNQDTEKFQVTSATIVNNKFNITVINTGNLPINFTKLWILNTTALSTDKVYYYSLTNSLVTPGGILKNIGQNIGPYTFQTTPPPSYHIKLVTSRGNTQEFNVNSVGTAPINIQFIPLPTNTPATGFKTTFLMVVTNNGSSTLTNLTPKTPVEILSPAPTAVCSLVQNQASPPSYNALPPGGTIIFKWDIIITGSKSGQICSWTAELVNGYTGNTATATATVARVTLASTDFAQTAGILTINYTTFNWSQGSGWKTGWQATANVPTVFKINMTNNNSTAGTNFYISKYTQLALMPNVPNGDAKVFYIAKSVDNPSVSPPTFTSYQCPDTSSDFCLSVPPLGTITLYFTTSSAQGTTVNNSPTTGQNIGFVIIFGKYAATQGGAGTQYGQNIPFIGWISAP